MLFIDKHILGSFDVKKRELVLPILKFMSKDIQDLMTLHEVGHAFWTTVDMMQKQVKERYITLL